MRRVRSGFPSPGPRIVPEHRLLQTPNLREALRCTHLDLLPSPLEGWPPQVVLDSLKPVLPCGFSHPPLLPEEDLFVRKIDIVVEITECPGLLGLLQRLTKKRRDGESLGDLPVLSGEAVLEGSAQPLAS